jgi:uncharacterized surface protein with fasciclin (FAS1) repeats
MKKSIFVFTATAFTLLSIASTKAQVKTDTTSTKTTTSTRSSTLQSGSTNTAGSQDTLKKVVKAKVVGGAEMLPTKDIVDNASKSKTLTTLVEAIKTTGLTDTLKTEGPFTVFAPTNDAFAKLPPGTLDSLKKSADKEKFEDVVEYHVVPGKLTSRDLAVAVARGNGTASLTTVEGDVLNVSINEEKNLQISDANGNIALVTMFDVEQSNGIVHVINNVLLPKEE